MWTFAVGDWDAGPTRELTQAQGRKLTFRRRGGHSASFTIDGRHGEAAHIDELISDLWVYRDGTAMFRGRVGPTSDDVTADAHTVQVSVGDYRAVLDRRILFDSDTLSRSSGDSGDMAFDAVEIAQARTNGDLGITSGVGVPSGVTAPAVVWQAGQSIAAAIDTIANLDADDGGGDWEIAPDLAFNFYPGGRGESRGVILDHGGLVRSFRRHLDPSQYANVVRLSGASYGTGEDQVYIAGQTATAADIATRDEGRWEAQMGDRNASSVTVAASEVAKLLEELSTIRPAYTVTLAADRWEGSSHIWLGDTCTLVAKSGRLNVVDELQVEQIDVTVSDDGDEQVDVTLGVFDPDRLSLAGQLRRLNVRLRDLERL